MIKERYRFGELAKAFNTFEVRGVQFHWQKLQPALKKWLENSRDAYFIVLLLSRNGPSSVTRNTKGANRNG